jgi:hypothetical protein
MNRSVAKRPRKPAAKKRAAGGGTPAWFRDPVPGDIIEVVATDEAGFLVWKAAQVDGVLVGSIPLRSFNVRWRWPKTGRPPHGGGEIEVFASHGWRKEKVSATVGDPVREFWTWECSHISVADEGWLWRWPAAPKPEPVVQPPAERIPRTGDLVYTRDGSRIVGNVERFPGRGGARFLAGPRGLPIGEGVWYYQDERGTAWDWQPLDTGTIQQDAVNRFGIGRARLFNEEDTDLTPRIPEPPLQFTKSVRDTVEITDISIPFSEIRRLVNAPEDAEIRIHTPGMNQVALLVTWKSTPKKETT